MKRSTIVFAIVWLSLFAGLAYLADETLNPNKASKLSHAKTVVLQRDPSGHYRAEAFINGVKARVLVDTGATGVAISQDIANTLRLKSNAAIRTHTANGETISYMVRLKSVKLGGIETRDVGATITPELDGDALLGMSFLSRMDIRLYQGTMTIEQVSE